MKPVKIHHFKQHERKVARQVRYYVLLAAIVVLGNWPLSFLQRPLAGDALNVAFPIRYFLGETLQNFLQPFWMPYITGGHPVYLESTFWYPVSWITAYVFGYSFYSFQLEYVLHLVFAAWGMYYLCRKLHFWARISMLVAIAYSFSGFFVGNAQHLDWIISGAWTPWVLASVVDLVHKPDVKSGVKLAVFNYLLLTGGSLSTFWFLQYVLLVFVLVALVQGLLHHADIYSWGLLKRFIMSYLLLFACGAYYLLALWQSLPWLSPTDWSSFSSLLQETLPAESLATLLFPFLATSTPEVQNMGFSMINLYVGLIPLLFIPLLLFSRPPWPVTFFFLVGLGTLALGLWQPLTMWDWLAPLPQISLSQGAILLQLLPLMGVLLAGGWGMHTYVVFRHRYRKPVLWAAGIMVAAITIGALVAAFHLPVEPWMAIQDAMHLNGGLPPWVIMLVQAPLQLAIVAGFIGIVWMRMRFRLIIPLLVLDLLLAYHLNAPYSQYMTASGTAPGQLDEVLELMPQGFPTMPVQPVGTLPLEKEELLPFTTNVSIYLKHPFFGGKNQFQLEAFESWQEDPQSKLLEEAPLAFLSGKPFFPGPVELSEEWLEHLAQHDWLPTATAAIEVNRLLPNRLIFVVNSSQEQMLVLLQNYFPGWEARVNGRPVEIEPVNGTFMAVPVTTGKNLVLFHHEPALVQTGYTVSLSVFFLLCIWVLVIKRAIRLRHYPLR